MRTHVTRSKPPAVAVPPALRYVNIMKDLREVHVSPSEARKNPRAQSQTLVFDDDVKQN